MSVNMSKDQTKSKKDTPALGSKKDSTKPPRYKRPNSEMCETSAEELTIMSHTLEDLSTEMKEVRDNLKTLMKKDDIETMIKTAVKDILQDFNKNLEFTVNVKVEEKTKGMCKKLEALEKENELLKQELVAQKTSIEHLASKMKNDNSASKRAEQKANYNEQYSRKNNIKFMDVPVLPSESEESLTTRICELVKEKDITLDPSKILAIHRIPGKPEHVQPVLVKLQNHSEKTKIMIKRSQFKASGNRLVDDVTRANGQLITRLFKHESIESAWYYNGSVYGKTNEDILPLLPRPQNPVEVCRPSNNTQRSQQLAETALNNPDNLRRPQSSQTRRRDPSNQEYDVRVASFSHWPGTIVQTPQQMAEAGFFYTGVGDIVRCYACDGDLRKWNPEDDPWIEHAHWFPHCIHLIRERGQDFINLIQSNVQVVEEEDGDDLQEAMDHLYINNNTGRESDDPIYSPVAQSAMEYGFSRAAVKMAIHECNNKNIRWKTKDLVNLLTEKQDQGETLPPDSPVLQSKFDVSTTDDIAAENEMLKRQLKCILCEEEEVNVLFLPCAHHNMCMTCAEDVTMCPICGKTIKEKIKTFMS